MSSNFFHNRKSLPKGILLHLLLPGLGHWYWKEYLFGLFVFLILLTASVLFVVSLFIELPTAGLVLLYGLPILFYVFSFADLIRVVKNKRRAFAPSRRRMILAFSAGILYQLIWPLAPVNFGWRNGPEIFVLDSTELSPLYERGALLKASRISYFLHVYFVEKKILHSLPERFELVRFRTESGRDRCGIVLGFPNEQVALVEGVLVVDDVPKLAGEPPWLSLRGNQPLTTVDGYSILIATIQFGTIDELHEVSFGELTGKVDNLF